MALRTLSPHVIITDELGRADEFESVGRAMSCGVSVAASMHSGSFGDIKKHSDFIAKAVRYIAVLNMKSGKRICRLYDTEKKTDEIIELT